MTSRDVYSAFFYGHTVESENFSLDFSEGAAELQASLEIGDYSLTTLLLQVKEQLNNAGALAYTVAVNRNTRIVTISADGDFELLAVSGSRHGTSVLGLLGFTTDKTGASTYTATEPCGLAYFPQFWLQDYVATKYWIESVDASVSVSSSGKVEVVKFGSQAFMECNFKYISNIAMPGYGPFINNQNALEDVISFLTFAIDKKSIEFMEDSSNPNIFETMILEATPESSSGTAFKLKENRAAAGFFDSGVLKFRKVT